MLILKMPLKSLQKIYILLEAFYATSRFCFLHGDGLEDIALCGPAAP